MASTFRIFLATALIHAAVSFAFPQNSDYSIPIDTAPGTMVPVTISGKLNQIRDLSFHDTY
jgi:hypothetical protein